MENTILIKDSNGSTILESAFIRFSTNSGRMAIMLDGGFNSIANSLIRNTKKYHITLKANGSVFIDTDAIFASYNFNFMSSTNTTDLVIGDNTLLFEALE